MAGKRPKIINNPIFNDFIYTILYNASYEEKRSLQGKFLNAAMSEAAAKKFATNSTKEEKELIMAHLGYSFFYVVTKNNVGYKKLKEILTKFENNKKASGLKDLAEQGIFVSGDREFLKMLTLMSQSIHHPSYFLNLEFLRQGYHIKKWAKRNLNKEDMESREAMEAASVLAKTFLKVIISLDIYKGKSGLSKTQMEILLYLWQYSSQMTEHSKIYDYFSVYINKYNFTSAMKELVLANFVEKHNVSIKREYIITGLGIKKVKSFFNEILN